MISPTLRRRLAYGLPVVVALVYIAARMGAGEESNALSNFAMSLISLPGLLVLMALMFAASWLGVLDRIHTDHRGTSFVVSGVLILIIILTMTSRDEAGEYTEFTADALQSVWMLVGAGIAGSITGMIHGRRTRQSQRPRA